MTPATAVIFCVTICARADFGQPIAKSLQCPINYEEQAKGDGARCAPPKNQSVPEKIKSPQASRLGDVSSVHVI